MSHAVAASPRVSLGLACIVSGLALIVLQDLAVKALLGDFTVWILIASRTVLSVLILAPVILYLGGRHRLFSPLWPLHLARALLFAVGFSLLYLAFPFLGLAEIMTLFFAAPLITALAAVPLLGERLGPHRWVGLIVGFIGVVIAMNPTGAAFQWVALLPLLSATAYAMAQLLARKIGDRDTTLTLSFYTVTFCGLAVVPIAYAVNALFDLGPEFHHIRWDWTVPPSAALLLVGVGALGLLGNMLIARAYQVADASLVAPLEYSYLPLAALAAFWIWGETPSWTTLLGMILIIASGVYIGYRELVQQKRALEPAPA